MALLDLKPRTSPQGLASPRGSSAACQALAAARSGDRAAFGRLVREFERLAFGIALRICGQPADAEEVAQDAFLQLHAQLGTLDDEHHLRHWLIRTVSHRAIDRVRHRGRRPQGDDGARLEALAAPSIAGDPLLSRALTRLVDELSGPARAVLALRFQEDLDPTDIAATLDMPLNTVKSHLRRSLEWLKSAAPDLTP